MKKDGFFKDEIPLIKQLQHELLESQRRVNELERGCCDVYAYLRHHDIGAAKIRLLGMGALP